MISGAVSLEQEQSTAECTVGCLFQYTTCDRPYSNLENALKKNTEQVKGVDMYKREGKGEGH